MNEIIIALVVFILIYFLFIKKENYKPLFSAHFYPYSQEMNYEQISRLPYSMPPTGPYSLGWNSLTQLKEEYPTQTQLYNLMYPS